MKVTGYCIERTLSGEITAYAYREDPNSGFLGFFKTRDKIVLGEGYHDEALAKEKVKEHAMKLNPDAVTNRWYMDENGHEDYGW